MKLLVVESSGLLGFKIAELDVEEFETFARYDLLPINVSGVRGFFRLDKTNRDATLTLMKKIKPDVVIDTPAFHNVDYCEVHRKKLRK